jgi:RHS repeat-associated protein
LQCASFGRCNACPSAPAGPQVAFGYDSGGRLTSADRTIGGSGTSVSTGFSYDAANRETGINDQVTTFSSGGTSGGSTVPLATYVYGYDSANRVTTEVDAEGTYTYTYDKSNELTGVDENGAPVGTYSYDLNGNRTGTGYSTTVMNETATSPGITYTYDNAGNMISAKNGTTTTTYTYDFDNRLTEVTQNGTVIATYVYDALNRRIGIDDNGTRTWTVYDGTNPYADFSGSGALEERYMYGPGVVDGAIVDQLLARTSSGGATAWYLPDKLGSVRDIVSSSGTELDHIVYDSFGNIVTETDAANGDRFKFAGMEYDSATGQYYDRARGYDSTLGRFTSLDPAGFGAGDTDLYRYVGNQVMVCTDTSGLDQDPPGGEPKSQPPAGYTPPGQAQSLAAAAAAAQKSQDQANSVMGRGKPPQPQSGQPSQAQQQQMAQAAAIGPALTRLEAAQNTKQRAYTTGQNMQNDINTVKAAIALAQKAQAQRTIVLQAVRRAREIATEQNDAKLMLYLTRP